MGNCQAVDAAALVIQHPCGKLERLYWPLTASEVMKANPGHYVSLIIPLPVSGGDAHHENSEGGRTVRFTRVKLLRPTDTLVLGRAYRLVTTPGYESAESKEACKDEEKYVRIKPSLHMRSEKQSTRSELDENDQDTNIPERHQQRRSGSTNLPGRTKSWRPSLQSISEAENHA